MTHPDFVLVTGMAVLFVTVAALVCVKFVARDVATRAALLFTTICFCLAAPFAFIVFNDLGISIRRTPSHSEFVAESLVVESIPLQANEIERFEAPTEITDTTAAPPQTPEPIEAPNAAAAVDSKTWLIYLWGAGAGMLLLRCMWAWSRLGRLIANSTPLKATLAQTAFDKATTIVAVVPKASLHVSSDASVPFAVGVLHPKVLLPSTWNQLTEDQLTDVLVHELSHLARRDPLKLILQEVAAAVYWPVITVHMVNRQFNETREAVCDNGVLNVRDAISYGETLLQVATLAVPKRMTISAVSFLRDKNSLEERITGLLDTNRDRRIRPSRAKLVPMTGVLALLVTAVCAFAATPQSSIADDPTTIAGVVNDSAVETTNKDDATVSTDKIDDLSSPRLTVRVVDQAGRPIQGAEVLLYDENKIRAGLERRFDNVLMRTNAKGECDFGELPLDHVAILVRRRVGEFNESVVHLFTRDLEPRLSANRLVRLEEKGDELVVTHTMRQGVDLKFRVVDAVTQEPIHFAAIHWKDPEAKRWWHTTLLDSGGQHDGTTLVPEMGTSIFRAARAGYEPSEVLWGRKLEVGTPLTRRIELKPHPKVKLSILTPDGKPAAKAQVEWSNRDGLVNEEFLRTEANANGILVVRYPPHPDVAQLKVTHESGTLSIRFEDIEPDGELNLQTLAEDRLPTAQSLPRIRVRVVDQNDTPVKDARVWVGDGEYLLGSGQAFFEPMYGTTDQSGVADIGILPRDFVRVHVLGNGFPQVYAMIGRTKGSFQQVTPRYFVEVEQTARELEVTFKLTPPTPVRFKVVDAETGEDVWWPEIFVRDGEKWWILSLIDGAGQHDFAPITKAMEGKTFRVTADGYNPKNFTFTALKAEGLDHTIELQRAKMRNPGDSAQLSTKPRGRTKTDWSVLKGRFVCDPNRIPNKGIQFNPQNQGVPNVVIWMWKPKGLPPEHEVTRRSKHESRSLTLANGRFQPQVVLLRTDQELEIKNIARFSRSILLSSIKNEPSNPLLKPGGRLQLKWPRPEVLPFPVNCSVVPGQGAFVAVKEHPYMAVSDANGQFEMDHVPSGEWTFQFWHPKLGYVQRVERTGKIAQWRLGRIQIRIEADSTDLGSVTLLATADN